MKRGSGCCWKGATWFVQFPFVGFDRASGPQAFSQQSTFLQNNACVSNVYMKIAIKNKNVFHFVVHKWVPVLFHYTTK
jgi:hypothetical protein